MIERIDDSVVALAHSAGRGCGGHEADFGAYFFEGKRVHRRCKRPPAFRVFVNPPRDGNDGTVLLCSFCNDWDYQTFRREPLATPKEDNPDA